MKTKTIVLIAAALAVALVLAALCLIPRSTPVDLAFNAVCVTTDGLVQQEGTVIIQGSRMHRLFRQNDDFIPSRVEWMGYSISLQDETWAWQKSLVDNFYLVSGVFYDAAAESYSTITLAVDRDAAWCVMRCTGVHEGQYFVASAEDTVDYAAIMDRCHRVFQCRFPETAPVDFSGASRCLVTGNIVHDVENLSIQGTRYDYSNGEHGLLLSHIELDGKTFSPVTHDVVMASPDSSEDYLCFEVKLDYKKSDYIYNARIMLGRTADSRSKGDWCILELGGEYYGSCFLAGKALEAGNEILDLVYPPTYTPMTFRTTAAEVRKNGNVLLMTDGDLVLDAMIVKRRYDKTKVELSALEFDNYAFPVHSLLELYFSDLTVNDFMQATWVFNEPDYGISGDISLLTLRYSREGKWCVISISEPYGERTIVVSVEEMLTVEEILSICGIVV